MAQGKIGRFTSPADREKFEASYAEGMRLLPEPAEVHDVSTAFGQVRAYRFGEGSGVPLVLLHGRSGTSVLWRPNLSALARRHRVYSIDLLGEAGGSTQTAPIRSSVDQAAWLSATLEGLGLDAVHLVGVSAGGWLACNQAVREPKRIASVSLLDPASTFARLPLGVILRTIPTILPLTAEWALPRFLRWVDGQGGAAEEDPVGRVIRAGLRYYRPALPLPTAFSDDQLRSIDVPTLVLLAGRSVMHDSRRALERARTLISGVQAELWPLATHAISGQCADEVNTRILRFIE
jgi:pimeloyl-ACP methyl ester carboxylesterase